MGCDMLWLTFIGTLCVKKNIFLCMYRKLLFNSEIQVDSISCLLKLHTWNHLTPTSYRTPILEEYNREMNSTSTLTLFLPGIYWAFSFCFSKRGSQGVGLIVAIQGLDVHCTEFHPWRGPSPLTLFLNPLQVHSCSWFLITLGTSVFLLSDQLKALCIMLILFGRLQSTGLQRDTTDWLTLSLSILFKTVDICNIYSSVD